MERTPGMQITVKIDGKTIVVHQGAMILEACRNAGASVPTLCQDDRLHPYGACRICMVELEGPPRRMVPACTTPAADRMSVVTKSKALIDARKSILELLLINHPLDCPVCDKAGECRLQDLVHEYGLGPSLFAEEKRTTPPDYASPAIEQNQNRCILCGKCVRTCTERCGVGTLTFEMRGGATRVSTAFGRPLDCEFCGECVDICPVGALTAKQGKHRSRPWNVEHTASTCLYCGCGCPITIETRGNEIIRVHSSGDHYLCAKGRFGWDAVRHETRLSMPKIRIGDNLVDTSWNEALSVVATNLKIIKNTSGAEHIGGLGSVRTTNEDNYLFQKFMRTAIGTNNIDILTRARYPYGLNTLYFAGELDGLREHDVILVLDGDAAEINPLMGIKIIEAAHRFGSRVVLAGNGQSKFHKIASVALPVEAGEALAGMIAGIQNNKRIVSTRIKQTVELLSSAKSTALVLPAGLSPETFALVQVLAGLLPKVTYYPVVMRGNIQGALDMGVLPNRLPGYQAICAHSLALFDEVWNAKLPESRGMDAAEMMSGIEHGKLSALYIMGDDPLGSEPRLAPIFSRLEFLVVQDIFMTETAKIANVVLPATSFLEKSGTMTTIERRLRHLSAAVQPWPDSRPDWQIIQAIAERMGVPLNYNSDLAIMKEIRNIVPLYTSLPVDGCWGHDQSPVCGTADLWFSSPLPEQREPAAEARHLFTSGMMTSRSGELARILRAMDPAS